MDVDDGAAKSRPLGSRSDELCSGLRFGAVSSISDDGGFAGVLTSVFAKPIPRALKLIKSSPDFPSGD